MFLPQTLLDTVNCGGGLIIDLSKSNYLPQTLVQLASAAAISGAAITIRISDAIMLPQTMTEVAMAGKGRVVFEI